MGPEQEARLRIDELLVQSGWQVQDYRQLNLSASRGVAIREFPLSNGTPDYLLFIDKKAAGAVEAKPVGATLGGVDFQSEKYLVGPFLGLYSVGFTLVGYISISHHFKDRQKRKSSAA